MAGLGCSLSRARSAAAAAGGLLVVVISGSTTAEGRGRVGGGGGGVVRGVEAVKAVWNLSAELGVVTGTADCTLNRRGRLVAGLAPVRCPNLCWPPNTEMAGPGRDCGLVTTRHESVVTMVMDGQTVGRRGADGAHFANCRGGQKSDYLIISH